MTIQAEQRIKVAVQKSGRLTDNSLHLMETCGLIYSRGRDQLICFGENMPVDVLLVRDDDIPELVAEGVCDLGIVGMNVFCEKVHNGMDVRPELELDFGRCRLSIAVPRGFAYDSARSLEGLRIATSYPRILKAWLDEQGVSAQAVTLSGAVEIAPRLGRADVICDLVSTGSTLLANDLVEAEVVFESKAALISRNNGPADGWPARLVSRMRGVLSVRESKYIMLHAPRSALPEIRRLLPGSESPTVMPLEGRDDKVAVHAVCRENVFWETLEGLKAAGASSMLVLPVEKMLA
jgi:ATP phosphoribosyltransferase